ncbi:MAG: efflux RND transporter periplasmic adaptor subunit, partial [Planctomycetales bacterium]
LPVVLLVLLLLVGAVAGGYALGRKQPVSTPPITASKPEKAEHGHAHGGKDDHGHDHGHDHGSAHKGEELQLPLSEQARQNLKLKLGEVELADFWRTIVVPGEVTERPGHSESRITSTVNGLIRRVYVLPGQTVKPGDPLFDIQTTGEVLANAQSALLKTLQELDLVEAELKRLKPIAEQGAVPGVRLLEKQYERQRLESARQVQTQELLVRGLSVEQIEKIVQTKILIREFTIHVPGKQSTVAPKADAVPRKSILPVNFAPESKEPAAKEKVTTPEEMVYSVERINVFPGKLTQAGDELCDLAVHTNLQIVGMAFQNESELISRVMEEDRPVKAIFETSDTQTVMRENLHLQYVDNVVDPQSRLFRFYIPITNEIVRDLEGPDGVKFRVWKFKPGQRVRLLVPVELYLKQIVLPTEAVVKEGAEAYVFRANGNLMERVAVTVKYEDPRNGVIAANGALFPGDTVALNEAYQLNLALRKLQGSGVDPHAGHDHAH